MDPTLTTATRWSLKDLFEEPVEPAIDEAMKKLEKAVGELEAMRPLMTADVPEETFKKALELIETIQRTADRIQTYPSLWLAQDTQNTTALNLRDRLDALMVPLGNRMLWFDIWFKDLPEEAAQRLISASGDYRYFLESVRRYKKYTLSERDESIMSLKDPNGIDAIVGLYDLITNHFTFNLVVNGEKKALTRDELSAYYDDASAELRAASYQEFYRVILENKAVLAQIYSHRVRDWKTEAIDLRGYASPISARNLSNDLPDEVVETLLSVCRKNTGIFQRYFKFKAQALGMPKLRRYDIYAPLAESDKRYDFDHAIRLVLDTFKQFSPRAEELAQQVVERQHLDSETRPGKSGGAFCNPAQPGIVPWVLVNYNGKPSDISTLAHEMGHAVHAQLAGDHPVVSFHAPLPLAETASTFAEMILTDRLLREETDPAVRRDLLVRTIDYAYGVILRQAYITIFEREAHRMLAEGKTFDEVADFYHSLLTEQFGDTVDVGNEYRWEWLTIPHIYETPFYTYSYSFGQLLVLALYQQYRLEGDAFVPRYLKLLSYGGAEAPMKILQEAGMDVTKPEFWQGGFDWLDRMITELAQIA